MSAFGAILRKDIRLELRSGESTIAMVALSMLILVVIVFALSQAGARGAEAAAGALWIALLFSGMLGATRTLNAERENGCISALLMGPIDRATIYLAKLAAALTFMTVAEAAAVILMVLFFNLTFDFSLLRVIPILMLGLLGFAALAIMLAAIAGHTRLGELMLPMLAVPIFIPALIAGVKASAMLLNGAPFMVASVWIRILIAFDVIYMVAGYLLFEHVVSTDV